MYIKKITEDGVEEPDTDAIFCLEMAESVHLLTKGQVQNNGRNKLWDKFEQVGTIEGPATILHHCPYWLSYGEIYIEDEAEVYNDRKNMTNLLTNSWYVYLKEGDDIVKLENEPRMMKSPGWEDIDWKDHKENVDDFVDLSKYDYITIHN